MQNRISGHFDDVLSRPTAGRCQGPQPLCDILAELLTLYKARFPQARIAIVESPAEK